MSLIPEAVEVCKTKYGCYYATSYYNPNCSVFTLISNSADFKNDVTNFIIKYVKGEEADITVLLVDLTELDVYQTTPIGVQIDLIEHDCRPFTPEGTLDLNPNRTVINFYDFMMKAIEQDALVNEKRIRKR